MNRFTGCRVARHSRLAVLFDQLADAGDGELASIVGFAISDIAQFIKELSCCLFIGAGRLS